MKKSKKIGRCVICGKEDTELTTDHLPPKSFFSDPSASRSNLITVKACDICNGGSSNDDEWFKVIAEIARKKILRSEDAKFRETLQKTFRGSPHIPKVIVESMRRVYLPTGPNGEFEEMHAFDLDLAPLYRTSERIVKGIFHKHSGEYCKDGYLVKKSIRNEINLKDEIQRFCHTNPHLFSHVPIMDSEFEYYYYRYKTNENVGMFVVLELLGGLEVFAVVNKNLQPGGVDND